MRGLKIRETAYGIGQAELEIPNVLRVYLAEMEQTPREGDRFQDAVGPMAAEGTASERTPEVEGAAETQRAWILECNIDDMNPEMYGFVMDTLFDQGADDVFITPIIMKKARPASKLSVLCPAEKKESLTEALLTHTTSLGVRACELEKTMLRREFSTLQTSYGEVTIKTAIYRGRKLKSKPEYEDCVRLARQHGIPVQDIYQEIAGLVNKDD
jgi:uncharacterized protein (DUF111 family)